MRVRYSIRARIQIETIGDFFKSIDASEAGTEILRRIKHAGEKLVDFPEVGRLGVVEGTRELSVKGIPYLLVYEQFPEDSDQIIILNVWHCSQEH